MENQRDPVVIRAIEIVRLRYTAEQWVMGDSKKVTKEIYDEIRRLDLMSVRTRDAGSRHAGPKFRRQSRVVEEESAGLVWAAE